MKNLTACKVYAKMQELATISTAAKSVDIPSLARAFDSPEAVIREYVQALHILEYVKAVEGDHAFLESRFMS
ncbi:MAG: hypothetical protein V4649_01840 [Bacteroidota bacterium]